MQKQWADAHRSERHQPVETVADLLSSWSRQLDEQQLSITQRTTAVTQWEEAVKRLEEQTAKLDQRIFKSNFDKKALCAAVDKITEEQEALNEQLDTLEMTVSELLARAERDGHLPDEADRERDLAQEHAAQTDAQLNHMTGVLADVVDRMNALQPLMPSRGEGEVVERLMRTLNQHADTLDWIGEATADLEQAL